MKYSLGPVLYYWHKNQMLDFYDKAKISDFDIVYLGESVCHKRYLLKFFDYLEIAKELNKNNKEVVISTLNLIESEKDINLIKNYIENGDFKLEVNDYAAVQLCIEYNVPFVAGANLNIYNAYSLRMLQKQGMVRFHIGYEISKVLLEQLHNQFHDLGCVKDFENEIFAYGYMPLAHSARCFTARYENRPKDDCKTCCVNYPEGKEVFTQENQKIFTINGIQTQSGYCYNLVNNLKDMKGLVDIVRLSAHNETIFDTLKKFKSNENGDNNIKLNDLNCNGYWLNIAGLSLQ